MIRFISLLVSIPIIILVAAFAYKNSQPVSLDFFVFQAELPLAIVLLLVLLCGFVLGFLFNLVILIRQQQKYRQLKNKKDTLQGLSGVLDKPES